MIASSRHIDETGNMVRTRAEASHCVFLLSPLGFKVPELVTFLELELTI